MTERSLPTESRPAHLGIPNKVHPQIKTEFSATYQEHREPVNAFSRGLQIFRRFPTPSPSSLASLSH